MAKIKVSAISYKAGKIDGFEDFAAKCMRMVEKAEVDQPDFVVFPEYLTGELMTFMGKGDTGKAYRGIAGYSDAYRDFFASLAKRKGLFIIAGSHLIEEKGKLYNTAHVFTPEGNIWEQRKLHLTPLERKYLSPGGEVTVFETDIFKFGVLTCYDLEFPEAARLAATRGAEIIFSPSATLDDSGYWRVRHCAQARCIENQVYVLNCCLIGDWGFPGRAFWGMNSMLCPCDRRFPAKGILAEGPTNQEAVTFGEFDLVKLRQVRGASAVSNLADIREDLCSALVEDLRILGAAGRQT
jgi:predicted amidohydrolase